MSYSVNIKDDWRYVSTVTNRDAEGSWSRQTLAQWVESENISLPFSQATEGQGFRRYTQR